MESTVQPVILTVDDSEIVRYTVSRILRQAGFAVQEATTGQEALRLAAEQPALILLDVNLPDLNGLDVCRRLKANPATAAIPVLHLSNTYVQSESKVKGLEGGADGYLTGDVEPEVLVATIKALLRMRQAERARQESEARFQCLVKSNIIGIASVADEHITEANDAFLQLIGYTREELQAGRVRWRALIPPDYLSLDDQRLHELKTWGECAPFEEELLRKDGGRVPVLLGAVRLAHEPLQWTCFVLDITERKRAEVEKERLLAALQRANEEFQHFAYIVSHDLHEPLRMVTSYVELLARRLRDTLDAETREFIGFAVDGATRMQQMLTNLLAYTRVGGQAVAFTTVDCEALLAQVLQDLQLAITDSGAVITHDRLPTLQGDATQLYQVFQNLLSNALKFCGAAAPRVHIAVRHDGAGWEFAVRDNGIGIDPQHAERIFQVFRRLHTRAEYPGAGMGLAICKKIVERHGGRMWVESQPGAGATFYFTLHGGGAEGETP